MYLYSVGYLVKKYLLQRWILILHNSVRGISMTNTHIENPLSRLNSIRLSVLLHFGMLWWIC